MVGLIVLFLILSIIFGFWGFAAATVWVGIKVLFWVFIALLIISIIGALFRPGRPVA